MQNSQLPLESENQIFKSLDFSQMSFDEHFFQIVNLTIAILLKVLGKRQSFVHVFLMIVISVW